MKEFLEFVVKQLVDHPEAIVIDSVEDGRSIVYKLTVAQGDAGKIIGKSGKTATSIRVLLRAIAAKEGKRATLDIVG